ncbi:carbonic anhydrase [Meredithblackwellia eburnea MCA 4105]
MKGAGAFPLSLALASTAVANCDSRMPWINHAKRATESPAFGYSPTDGPILWHTLSPEFELCGTGIRQSPILIDTSDIASLAPEGSIQLNIANQEGEFENRGTNVEVVVNGTMNDGVEDWNLKQFHFHTPSEHRLVDSGFFEAETHFVFSAADGSERISVVSFMYTVDGNDTTPVIEQVLSRIGDIQEVGQKTAVELEFQEFTAEVGAFRYFNYSGSLTTPPCSEGVSWHVATTPLKLSLERFQSLKSTITTNNRFIQSNLGEMDLIGKSAVGLLCMGQCKPLLSLKR